MYHLSAKVRIPKTDTEKAPDSAQTRWKKVEAAIKENQLKTFVQTICSELSTTHSQFEIKLEDICSQVESYSALIT